MKYNGNYVENSKEAYEKLIELGYKGSALKECIGESDMYVLLLDNDKISIVDKEAFFLVNFQKMSYENGNFIVKFFDVFDQNKKPIIEIDGLTANLKKFCKDNQIRLGQAIEIITHNSKLDLFTISDNDLNDLFLDYISSNQNLIK